MGGRGFLVTVAVWGGLCWLATTWVGAVMGFAAAFGGVMLAAVLTPPVALALLWICAVSLAAVAGLLALFGLKRALRGDWREAYARWAVAVSIAGVPLSIWLAFQSLQTHWQV